MAFGTDLSMIREELLKLTCQQAKLNFKKEERQNRLRLFEASASRAKGETSPASLSVFFISFCSYQRNKALLI